MYFNVIIFFNSLIISQAVEEYNYLIEINFRKESTLWIDTKLAKPLVY